MADAVDVHGVVFKNGSATLLARVVGADGAAITQATIDTIKYTIYLLDENDPDAGMAVTGHTDVSVEVAPTIFDALQLDALWGDLDASGYNFKHVLDISSNQAFAIAGRNYRVVFTLTPVSGQPILVRFRVSAV